MSDNNAPLQGSLFHLVSVNDLGKFDDTTHAIRNSRHGSLSLLCFLS